MQEELAEPKVEKLMWADMTLLPVSSIEICRDKVKSLWFGKSEKNASTGNSWDGDGSFSAWIFLSGRQVVLKTR